MKMNKRNLFIVSLYFFSFLVSPFSIQAETVGESTQGTVADVETGIEEVTDSQGEQEPEETQKSEEVSIEKK